MMIRARTESDGMKRVIRAAICESGEIIRLKFMAPFHAKRMSFGQAGQCGLAPIKARNR
jgi:hypothetical protein